eukprot:symbB.v1.2.005847.t1/scaffold343.1/size224757/24
MAGEAGKNRTVLLATEKAFAAGAVAKIESVVNDAKYTLKKLENYKSKDDLLAAVEGVDAMIIRSDIVDAAVLEKAKQLKIVVRAGAGYDNIDLKACESKSVVAMNTPGQNANAVAELVFGMMLGQGSFKLEGLKLLLKNDRKEAAVGDKFGKRLIFTKKKMGAQTAEANDNAGVAAANQIVGFFEKGETRFSLKA